MALALTSPSLAGLMPTFWGMDEADGTLLKIDPAGMFTRFAPLRWNDGGSIHAVGSEIGAFTLDRNGTGFFALNPSLGKPVLLRLDVNTASTGGSNVADVVGRFDMRVKSGAISGLSFHPGTGMLYALFQGDDNLALDRLLQIDTTTGNMVDLGLMTGLGEVVDTAEDMIFDSAGNLFVSDRKDDHMYRVDPMTAAIVEIVDSALTGGVGVDVGDIDLNGLSWDPFNPRMIIYSDPQTVVADIPLVNGNNGPVFDHEDLLDIKDVRWLASIPQAIPGPGTLALLALAALCRRRRPRSSC